MMKTKNKKKEIHLHSWDKVSGQYEKGKPWVGIKGRYVRICIVCNQKQYYQSINVPGFSMNGWEDITKS